MTIRNAYLISSIIIIAGCLLLLGPCKSKVEIQNATSQQAVISADTIATVLPSYSPDTIKTLPATTGMFLSNIDLATAHPLVDFAKTLIGTPYKYGSTDPAVGFDCSGFITFVFNHFKIPVPRSSVEFTNVGRTVGVQNAREGDLVLFTGTDDSIRIVGHMGIVTENTDTLRFIHSTSGRANGVTISSLSPHYQKRFVKVIRVFADQ